MLQLDRRKLDLILAERCYSLTDVTKRAGLSSALVTKVVSGKYTLTTKTLGKMAKALGVKPADLIKDEQNTDKGNKKARGNEPQARKEILNDVICKEKNLQSAANVHHDERICFYR